MSLEIIKAGICDTFQDEGRKGYQHLGINPVGAMDVSTAKAVNALAGNPPNAAILEMNFPAATILFRSACLLVIGGADFASEINGTPVANMQPVWVPAESTLHFRQRRSGSWCYLTVHGGFQIEPWLNSCSTHLKAVAGGWKGRALVKGDCIPFGMPEITHFRFPDETLQILPWSAVPWQDPAPSGEIWITEGPEHKLLDDAGVILLVNDVFTVLPASDRMAYSLKGLNLNIVNKEEQVSAGVAYGTLQLLPDGQMIVLMADHQTTGGYPRIGQVIQAHLSRLSQCSPGDKFRFRMVTQQQAQQLWLSQYRHLRILEYACRFKLESLKLQS